MGKPRMIILIRHAQSEGNKNRDIHQFIPDHRVRLTPDGYRQAEDAGRRLRSMLKADDKLQFFTSPYRRTRETTEGILKTLTDNDPTPSPFPRHTITVYEEPRLREQDFGNFQPCSAEMERMWQERADYGHFFYRIPNGESAADAYDRVSGFNESLWRQFGDADFPSVCVLVTHGLMTRVFLMKWYHWSVEYFEDLRNVNHCEFIVMKQNEDTGKYVLENQLRTWSDLKKRAALVEGGGAESVNSNGSTAVTKPTHKARDLSPGVPARRWGGCANGCDHDRSVYPRRARRQNTADFYPATKATTGRAEPEPFSPVRDLQKATEEITQAINAPTTSSSSVPREQSCSPDSASNSASNSDDEGAPLSSDGELRRKPHPVNTRDLGSQPEACTPAGGTSDDSDYFKPRAVKRTPGIKSRHGSLKSAVGWKIESGMGAGVKADKLGDFNEMADGSGSTEAVETVKQCEQMAQARKEEEAEAEAEVAIEGGQQTGSTRELMVDKMKEGDRKSMREVF